MLTKDLHQDRLLLLNVSFLVKCNHFLHGKVPYPEGGRAGGGGPGEVSNTGPLALYTSLDRRFI